MFIFREVIPPLTPLSPPPTDIYKFNDLELTIDSERGAVITANNLILYFKLVFTPSTLNLVQNKAKAMHDLKLNTFLTWLMTALTSSMYDLQTKNIKSSSRYISLPSLNNLKCAYSLNTMRGCILTPDWIDNFLSFFIDNLSNIIYERLELLYLYPN